MISGRGATNAVRMLVDLDILRPSFRLSRGTQMYEAPDVLKALI
jgi:hypothetical protein